MRITKRRLIALVFVVVLGLLVYFEMRVWAPKRLSLHFETVISSKIPASFDGTSIAVISDLNSDIDNLELAVAAIEAYQPEMILFAGNAVDMDVENFDSARFAELLNGLSAPLGKFAITKADEPDSTRMLLQTTGFTVLNNQALTIHSGNLEAINLVGFNTNISVNLEPNFTLGLTYDPSLIKALDTLKLDAVVAGMTHLGHINFPIVGSLIHHNEITQRRSMINGYDLILTSGVSTNAPKVRLMSHPDVLILTLKSS